MNMPMMMTSVEAGRKKHNKHCDSHQEHTNPDHARGNHDRDDHSQDINDHRRNPNQDREQERQWNDFLGKEHAEEGALFKALPLSILDFLQKKRVKVEFGYTEPFFIQAVAAYDHSSLLKTGDHRNFSQNDTAVFYDGIGQMIMRELADEDRLCSPLLVDALNKLKDNPQREQGQNLLFPESFTHHEGPFALDFLQDHTPDVQHMFALVFSLFSNPNDRGTLEMYAPEMLEYMKQQLSEMGKDQLSAINDKQEQEDEIQLTSMNIVDKRTKVHIRYEEAARNYFTAQGLNADDDAWNWITNFVTLSAILNQYFGPTSIEMAIKDSKSGRLMPRLTSNESLIRKYGSEKLQIYATELDAILREQVQIMETLDPEAFHSSILDAATTLSYAATVAAAAIYDDVQFDGLTREESKRILERAMLGDYYLTRDMFRELPNEVAIRKGSGDSRRSEVIPGARYTTDIITITREEIRGSQRDPKINREKFQPLIDLIDGWDVQLKELQRRGTRIPHADLLSSIKSDYLITQPMYDEFVIIATISYNNQVQGITVGGLSNDVYTIEYSFTAPHNILANEGTYQGATNHLVSSVISHIFHNHPKANKVTTRVRNPYNVKSGIRLGFNRNNNDIPSHFQYNDGFPINLLN